MKKNIVVTGGTKGIGRAIIEKCASEGFNIATCARNEQDLQKLERDISKQYSVRVITSVADVSKKEELSRFLTKV
ncbi:MAG: SDR family NAD(P)-dependent oxidoreductase, partial [Bacteroidota bacterium]